MKCVKNKISIKKKRYYELSLNENVKNMWKKDPYMRALKRKRLPSRPVEEVFIQMLNVSRKMKTKEYLYDKYNILKILDMVIPHEYFGSSQNRKRFYHLVNKITTQSRFERVSSTILCEGYDLEVIDWLQRENLNKRKQKSLLFKANYYTLKYIVKPIIGHGYYPLISSHGYKITFIKRSYMIPSDLSHDSHCRGVLRLYPKKNCDSLDYRPITCPHKKDKQSKLRFKKFSRLINKLALEYSPISAGSIYNQWKEFAERVNDTQCFGIKMDIEDAFGNVNVTIVCELINTSTLFNSSEKEFIKNHLSNQFICYKHKLYKWTRGILQGDNLSSSICNLFISFLEYKCNLKIFRQHCLLSRHVDDYLLCSVNYNNIEMFEKVIKEYFCINETKTEKVDFSENNKKVEINYYGQTLNLQSKEVCKLYKFDPGDNIRYKFNFWSSKQPKDRINTISRTLQFSFNNHCFKKLELNTSFNKEETVLKNYFEGMIFIAYKFDACVKSFVNFRETGNEMNIFHIVKNTVHLYAAIALSIIKKLKGKYFMGNITFRLMLNIGYIAFKLVLKRSAKFYSNVIESISKKNLYLKFDNIDLKVFTKLPKVFQEIRVNRKSVI